ncbi:MAG: hypothetical protein KDA28_09360, partial [Phycisphaerales bacterium]|nr:hypothetical protein [Phycisphaerales bacterium]
MTRMLLALAIATSFANGQAIDFETLPDGTVTPDEFEISDQYEADFGVRFDLVDPVTLEPIGLPRIAKVGSPQTAFEGCGPDTPLEDQGAGLSMLTDDGSISNNAGTLLVTYTDPVAQAAGVVIDVDRRGNGTYEEWTIDALDASMTLLESQVVTAPMGEDVCRTNYGPG